MGSEDSEPLAPSAPAPGGIGLPGRLLLLGLAALLLDLAAVIIKAPLGHLGLTLGDLYDVVGTYAQLALVGWVAAGLVADASANSSPRGRIGDHRSTSVGPGRSAVVLGPATLLLLAGITFALGRGIHLAANSIHDLIDRAGAVNLAPLASLWDEGIGHYAADVGKAGFAVGLALLEGAHRAGGRSGPHPARWIALGCGGRAYGFITFGNAVEGQTVPFALPFAAAYLAAHLLARRRSPGGQATVRGFFAAACGVQILFFAIWGIWKGGFPEFTKAGMLP